MKILLVNPNYYERVYGRSLIKMAINRGTSPLGLALLAAIAARFGHETEVFDMNVNNCSVPDLLIAVGRFKPELIGFTMTTPLFSSVRRSATALRTMGNNVLLAAGGPHPTALPEETIRESGLDYVVSGPGDVLFPELLAGRVDYRGLWTRADGTIREGTVSAPEVRNLDDLPYPRYNPDDIPKYVHSQLTSRRNPVANMESSRGCFADCVFCNKKIFGHRYLAKSPARVVDEMEFLLREGFREIHIVDDGFSTLPDRVIEMCEEILRRGLEFTWYPNGGIRADRASPEMFRMMKKTGCYKVPFGVESGSQRVLDVVGKRLSLEAVEQAVRWAAEAGLETECNFMIGLPTESERDAARSFAFARKLRADYVKFAITIPLPGTRLFAALDAEGRLLSRDWDLFNFATDPALLYSHDRMPSSTIYALYKKYNKRYYFRFSYILKRVAKSLREKRLLSDLRSAFALLHS